jgi:hypothetical protein
METSATKTRWAHILALSLLILTGYGQGSLAAESPRQLNPALSWAGNNRERLDEMMRKHGVRSPSYDKGAKPVAVFDWDNTVIKNDIGDAVMYWLVRHGKILQPPGRDWAKTSRFLSDAARGDLAAACAGLAEPGSPLPTDRDNACADALVHAYANGKTRGGEPAWTAFNPLQMEPSYAWLAQLLAGYKPWEVRSFAAAAADENLAAAVGTKQSVGTVAGLNGYIRFYEPMRDLIGALQDNGFDVWILSASPQFIVEPLAARVGVMMDQVIGIRSIVSQNDGVLSYDLQGCGGVRDGENTLITYVEGKRCWINKVIFGDRSASAGKRASKRHVFAAGDSDTDTTFLQDATVLKLVINRNKEALMCNALANAGKKWIVNPMFIDPLPVRAQPYPCSTSACRDATGAKVGCVDENGKKISDLAEGDV